MRHRTRIVAVGLLLCALVAAACGQKKGVHLATGGGGGGGAAGSAGASVGGTTGSAAAGGLSAAAAGTTGTAGGSSAAAGTPSASAGGSGTPSAAGTTGATAGAKAPTTGATSGPVDRTGVTDSEIRIGIHAPVTGAAPFPVTAFSEGAHLYFKYINDRGGVNGRKVTVFFEDDQYNPGTAVQVCKKMVEQDHVFMLVGGGGTDQIVACAQYAASVGVPYLAEGVAEAPLKSVTSYFALSMSYPQQATLLAQYIKNVLHKTKVAMIRADTANFEDAHTAFAAAAKAAGLQCSCDFKLPKDAGQPEAQTAAGQLKSSGAEVVYPLMSPVVWLNLVAAAHGQLYDPRWAGVGITLGLNDAANVACGSIPNGASFFSPFPGIDKIDAIDPAYQKAYQQYYGKSGGDIGIALWGAEKLLAAMLAAPGKDVSRQAFVAAVNGKSFHTGVYPDVNYSKSRFGGTAVHVLKADCSKRQYITEFLFKSGF